MLQPIEFSESALNEIKNIMESKKIPADYFLRIGVKGGGCAGVDHVIGFDTQHENDQVFDFSGVKVLILKKDFMYLMGTRVDFLDSTKERGFIFHKD